MFTDLFKLVLENSLITSVYIIIFLIFKKLLLNRYSAKFNYYIWLFLLFKLTVLFKIPIYIKRDLVSNGANMANSINQGANIISQSSVLDSIMPILAILWVITAINFYIYNNLVYIYFKNNLYKNSLEVCDDKVKDLLENEMKKLHLSKKISLRFSDEVHSPLGVGYFKSYIYLPNKDYSTNELKFILKHELIHFKRHDLLYKKLILFCKCVYWFNPLMYKLDKLIDFDCELSCDERLLQDADLDTIKDYASILVKSAKFNNCVKRNKKLVSAFNGNDVKRRVEYMFNSKIKKNGLVLGALLLTVVGGSMFSFKSFADSDNLDVNQNTDEGPSKVIVKDGKIYTNVSEDEEKELIGDGMNNYHYNTDEGPSKVIVKDGKTYTNVSEDEEKELIGDGANIYHYKTNGKDGLETKSIEFKNGEIIEHDMSEEDL